MSNINDWLKNAAADLEQAGISTARLDVLVLLEDCAGKERGWLLAHPEFEISEKQIEQLESSVKRRAEHEPLAYIRNKTEFYGREFYLDHRVLEPRPESETMIELLKSLSLPATLTIIDVGTGSGALAITAKLEFPAAQIIASDIDTGCLEVAKLNAQNCKVSIDFFKGDLLEPLKTTDYQSAIIIANLPYVPDNYQINQAALNEPAIAIFGGRDGLDLYRRMFEQLKNLTQIPQFILAESMPPQHPALAKIANSANFHLLKTDDFIQVYTTN